MLSNMILSTVASRARSKIAAAKVGFPPLRSSSFYPSCGHYCFASDATIACYDFRGLKSSRFHESIRLVSSTARPSFDEPRGKKPSTESLQSSSLSSNKQRQQVNTYGMSNFMRMAVQYQAVDSGLKTPPEKPHRRNNNQRKKSQIDARHGLGQHRETISSKDEEVTAKTKTASEAVDSGLKTPPDKSHRRDNNQRKTSQMDARHGLGQHRETISSKDEEVTPKTKTASEAVYSGLKTPPDKSHRRDNNQREKGQMDTRHGFGQHREKISSLDEEGTAKTKTTSEAVDSGLKSPPEKSPRRNNNQRKTSQMDTRHGFGHHSETTSSQEEEGTAKTETTSEAMIGTVTNTNSNDANGGENHGRMRVPRERPRWRSRPSRPHPNSSATHRPETHVPKCKPATSEWIMVSNVPPMSELSDLCQSLNQILDYEVQKGIIDLDALGDLENGSSDDAAVYALKRIDALGSLYSTQQICDGDIPLRPTSSSSHSHSLNDVPSMILEARVYLSYRARPMGWFIRLPDRSVVHALLNHVRRAEEYGQQQYLHLENGETSFKEDRREWRKELWMGVWTDYERGVTEKVSRAMLEDENYEEKELMWGEDLGEEETNDSSMSSPFDEAAETVLTSNAEEQQNDADDYLQKYLESNPYPVQSTKTSTTQDSQYQVLKSGSTALNVQEFSPHHSDFPLHNNEQPSWEQHSFHLSHLLNLSDSVIRVETSHLKTSVEDVKYMFRGYDMDVILPVSHDSTTLPSCFTDFPKSLGWNMESTGNVDYLVKGFHSPRPRPARYAGNSKEASIVRAKRHFFLVRLASPADARMAVRDMDGTEHYYERLSVTQYPRQW